MPREMGINLLFCPAAVDYGCRAIQEKQLTHLLPPWPWPPPPKEPLPLKEPP